MSVLSDLMEQRKQQSDQPRITQRATQRLGMTVAYALLLVAGTVACFNYHSITTSLAELLGLWF